MNKKGIIAIVIIIILIVIGYVVWGGSDTADVVNNGTPDTTVEVPSGVTKDAYTPVTSATTDTSLLGRLKTSSVSAAETGNRVALVAGKATFTAGNAKGTITLGDVALAKTSGGTNYALGTLAVNSGGAPTFQYVVLFEDKNGTLTDKSYAVIGDRVKITGLRADEVSDGKGGMQLVVSVSYMDYAEQDDPKLNPTIPRTKILVVEGGVFNASKEISL